MQTILDYRHFWKYGFHWKTPDLLYYQGFSAQDQQSNTGTLTEAELKTLRDGEQTMAGGVHFLSELRLNKAFGGRERNYLFL